ncbi:TolC family protein [Sulfurimonas sp.]
MKKSILILVVPFVMYAHSLTELFTALKEHAQTKEDEMLVQKSVIEKDLVYAQLYPKVNLFASYDNYSTPTGMIPVPPDTLVGLVSDPANPTQPFTYNMYKTGAKFSMPLFVKSIYTTAKKAQALQKSAKAKKELNLLKNEAVIVGANANFLYLNALLKALHVKEKSLQETKKTTQIKVNNGRAPASTLYKINDALNQVAIAKNNIQLQKKKFISTIETLTGIVLEQPVQMQEKSSFSKGEMKSLQPLEEKVRADRLGIQAQKEKLYPTLTAHGSYVFSKAKAYNNGLDANEKYGNVGIVVNIPLLAMDNYTSIKLSKIKLHASEIALEKLSDELHSQAKMLEDSLPLLDNSLKLYSHSVADKKKLLVIAKVSYKSGRLSTEEYLRYEDDVVAAEANLYKTKATKWQTLMQLAVIYANNIEEMVQ